MGRHPKHPLVVTDDQRSELQRLVRAHSTPQALAKRATMILYLDQGMNQRQTAEHIGCARSLVSHWRKRFIELGMYGLQDAPRSGRPRTISDERVAQVVEQTLETTPEGHTHWSQRLMTLIYDSVFSARCQLFSDAIALWPVGRALAFTVSESSQYHFICGSPAPVGSVCRRDASC